MTPQPEVQPQAQPQLPSWTQFAAGLPHDIPDEAYDSLREKYFNEYVAPEALKEGHGIETVRKQFMGQTERTGKAAYPRAELIAKQALASFVAPMGAIDKGTAQEAQDWADRAAGEAHQQGINPAPYQFAGSAVGQLPYWATGMGVAGDVSSAVDAGPLLEKTIKTAAGGVIQGSYDAAKTQNIIEGLKGAASGAAMVGGFEALGPLKNFLTGRGLLPEQAEAVEQVGKGLASDEQWKTAIDTSLSHGRLDDDIAAWVGEQVQSAKQAGVAQKLTPDFSLKGLSIKMTGADGKPYEMQSPTSMPATMTRMAEHLQAGGWIDEITGPSKAVSQFYQTLSEANPDSFKLDLPVKDTDGKPSNVTMPASNDAVQVPKAGMNLNDLINARNSVYHATDLEGFRGILESGEIRAGGGPDNEAPNWTSVFTNTTTNPIAESSENQGVSISRTPRLASKADKAITFVIDQTKMPSTRPYVEEGYGKESTLGIQSQTEAYRNTQGFADWFGRDPKSASIGDLQDYVDHYSLPAGPHIQSRNPNFEFEDRTYNEPIPLKAVRGIIVDAQALDDHLAQESAGLAGYEGRAVSSYDEAIEHIQKLAKDQNIPVKIMDSGQDVHSYRAGLSKQPDSMKWGFQIPQYDQLETLPTGQVQNKLTGSIYNTITDALEDKPLDEKANLTELVRGSANIPLDKRGHTHVDWVGDRLAQKGGLDKLVTSDSIRTQQTADAILDHNHGTQLLDTTPNLQSWAKGTLEGSEHTPEVQAYSNQMAEDFPDHKIGGMSQWSTRAGESFNDMRYRVLPYVDKIVKLWEQDPTQKLGVVTHFSPIRLVESWVKNGMPDDFSVDLKDFTRERAQPAGVYKLFKNSNNEMKMRKVNLENDQQLEGGIYFIRHGETPFNRGGSMAMEAGASRPEPAMEDKPSSGVNDFRSGEPKETLLSYRTNAAPWQNGMPDQAYGMSTSNGPGEKPNIDYNQYKMAGASSDQAKAIIFHENLHGHFAYMDLAGKIAERFDSDPIVHDIFHGAFPDDAKAIYKTPQAEEIFNYAASAVRTNDQQLLDKFGKADTDTEHVLDWTSSTAKEIMDMAAEAPDSLHKRVLERRLNAVVSRASGSLDDANRSFVTSPMELDIERGQYAVREGDSTDYFDDREQAIRHMEAQYQEPLQAPELIQTQSIPDGTPRLGLNFDAPTNKPPLTTDAVPADKPGPIKAGTSVFSFFFRPFYDWLSDVSIKHNRPDLYSAFSDIDEKLKDYQNIIRPFQKTLSDTLGKFGERQGDFMKWIQADDIHKSFVEKELRFSPEEISALHTYNDEFLSKFQGLKTYLTEDMEKLRNVGYDPKQVWPKGKGEGIAAELTLTGRIDPQDVNLHHVSSIWARSVTHGAIVEPAMKVAEDMVNDKEDGKNLLGQLAPLLRRHLAYLRGTPDMTAKAVGGALEATIDSINQGIGKVNGKLPDNLQIPQIDSPAQDLLQRYIMLSYAGAMAARPAVLVRAALQTFLTSFPLTGSYITKGFQAAFEETKNPSSLGATDAWKTAAKYGAFVEKANIEEMLAGGGGLDWEDKLGDKALKILNWTHNVSRLVSFWSHSEKALDALYEVGHDSEAFTKQADLWFMPESMRAKYLKELPNVSPDKYEDFSRRIGSDLTGLTQWNYRKGASPGMYKWQLGRLFGQYGTWPLNYIEYGRRFAQGADKTAAVQALTRLTLAHGSVMAAGAAAGVNTGDWTFFQPMAYGGGPLLHAVVGLPTAAGDWSSPKGHEARQDVLDMLNPFNLVPGSEEAAQAYKAVTSNDPNILIRLMGFKPAKD